MHYIYSLMHGQWYAFSDAVLNSTRFARWNSAVGGAKFSSIILFLVCMLPYFTVYLLSRVFKL